MESPGKRLRRLIEAPEILVMPGVFDGFSTRLVARAGYPAAFITGSGVSESRLGQPDVGLMGLDASVRRRACAKSRHAPAHAGERTPRYDARRRPPA